MQYTIKFDFQPSQNFILRAYSAGYPPNRDMQENLPEYPIPAGGIIHSEKTQEFPLSLLALVGT